MLKRLAVLATVFLLLLVAPALAAGWTIPAWATWAGQYVWSNGSKLVDYAGWDQLPDGPNQLIYFSEIQPNPSGLIEYNGGLDAIYTTAGAVYCDTWSYRPGATVSLLGPGKMTPESLYVINEQTGSSETLAPTITNLEANCSNIDNDCDLRYSLSGTIAGKSTIIETDDPNHLSYTPELPILY